MGRPMVVSTGMCDLSWVRSMVTTLLRHTDKLVLLQCTSSYPTLPRDTCLRVLDTYRAEFPHLQLGYSGHETGIAISVAAGARGARVIERHVTLDKAWKGSDHKCSLDMKELEMMCHLIKKGTQFQFLKELFTPKEMSQIEEAMEVDQKTVLASEQSCLEKLGKTVVAARDIEKGSVISEDDVCVKVSEPRGIDPKCVDSYIGKIALCDIDEDCSIQSPMLGCVQYELVQSLE